MRYSKHKYSETRHNMQYSGQKKKKLFRILHDMPCSWPSSGKLPEAQLHYLAYLRADSAGAGEGRGRRIGDAGANARLILGQLPPLEPLSEVVDSASGAGSWNRPKGGVINGGVGQV